MNESQRCDFTKTRTLFANPTNSFDPRLRHRRTAERSQFGPGRNSRRERLNHSGVGRRVGQFSRLDQVGFCITRKEKSFLLHRWSVRGCASRSRSLRMPQGLLSRGSDLNGGIPALP
jgi:hypothetical protein